MPRRIVALAAAAAATAAGAPAVAGAAPMPREEALDAYSGLWHKCADSPACDAPRNVRRHGIKFKWRSENGERRHWGTRPPDAEDVASRIRRLRGRLSVLSLTPFAGPDGTRWAIPWYIVDCESHGTWTAANPSGAIGPYQLLGKGAPWPANTAAARMEHHRIAANLWAGGAGASHWVCA